MRFSRFLIAAAILGAAKSPAEAASRYDQIKHLDRFQSKEIADHQDAVIEMQSLVMRQNEFPDYKPCEFIGRMEAFHARFREFGDLESASFADKYLTQHIENFGAEGCETEGASDGTDSSASITMCMHVDARKGWQQMKLPGGDLLDIGYDGSWTVDTAHYEGVGAQGHTGEDAEKLAPFSRYKYTNSQNFGALLVRIPGRQEPLTFRELVRNVEMARKRSKPFKVYNLGFRINDSDASLDDNSGLLGICALVGN